MRIHNTIETEVEITDAQMFRLLGLPPKGYLSEVKREKKDWPKEHYVTTIKVVRHTFRRRK